MKTRGTFLMSAEERISMPDLLHRSLPLESWQHVSGSTTTTKGVTLKDQYEWSEIKRLL